MGHRVLSILRLGAVGGGLLALYFFEAWHIGSAIGPFRGDPDYPYLFGGLSLLNFHTPAFVDHPGTPVQLLIAAITLLLWLARLPFHPFIPLTDDVITHSQFYLACICCVFTLGMAVAMVFFVRAFRAASGQAAPALLALLCLLASDAIFFTFHRVYAEPALLAISLVLAGLLAGAAFRPADAPSDPRLATAIGICVALCIATKITAAPVALAILMLPDWRARKRAFATTLLCGVALLLPIWRRWPHLIVSNFHILTHQGDYGHGGAGLPPLHTLWQNMVLNNSYAPEMSLALELFALVLLGARWRKIKLPHSFHRTLLVSGAIIAATILLVAKQPREAYFIPAFAFAGLGLALILFLALENLRHRRTVTVVAGLLLVLNAVYAQQIHTAHENDNWRADAQIMARATNGGCLVVPYYFVDWPQWDLYFADPDHRFAPALARLYPDFVTYDVGAKTFASFAGALSPDQAARRFAKEKCVRLWGQIWQRDFGLAPSALTLIQRSQYHAVYALNTDWRR